MTDYFVRVSDDLYDKFFGFCLKHKLSRNQLSEWPSHGTTLYMISMKPSDVTALKLSIPISIMEAPK